MSSLLDSQILNTQDANQQSAPSKQVIHEAPQLDENHSVYSGGSGLAPSLVSHTINYFPQGGKTEEDVNSAMQEQENESGGSSEDTNSMHVEDSFHDAISEEVSYSQSTDSEHEEEHEEDVIQQKEASFNHQTVTQQNRQNSPPIPLLQHS